jgi:hypothetical protein
MRGGLFFCSPIDDVRTLSIGPSLALALRAAFGCTKRLSCRFVRHLNGKIPGLERGRGFFCVTGKPASRKALLHVLHSRHPWRSCPSDMVTQNQLVLDQFGLNIAYAGSCSDGQSAVPGGGRFAADHGSAALCVMAALYMSVANTD